MNAAIAHDTIQPAGWHPQKPDQGKTGAGTGKEPHLPDFAALMSGLLGVSVPVLSAAPAPVGPAAVEGPKKGNAAAVQSAPDKPARTSEGEASNLLGLKAPDREDGKDRPAAEKENAKTDARKPATDPPEVAQQKAGSAQKPVPDGRGGFAHLMKAGNNDSALRIAGAALTQPAAKKGEEQAEAPGGPGTAAKSDFTAVLQKEPSAAPLQTTQTAAPEAARTAAPQTLQAKDPAELFDHTVSIVRDGNRLAVQLHPDGLGKLDISLSLDRGTVNAHINVANHAAQNLIESNMQQIVDALVREGISVGGFSVGLRDRGRGDDAAAFRQDGPRERTVSAPEALAAAAAAGGPGSRGLVNIFI